MPLIRPANFSLFIEILLRISLLSAFCYMESMTPFYRVIHENDLTTDYKYPRKDSYVSSSMLWSIVLAVPCLLSVTAWGIFSDCNDALEILLAWSLALGINGVLTDMMKLIAGRPRPDFFYRCFPDGVMTQDLQCTGDLDDITDGRKSFPSGHSSLSCCSLGVACAWLCGRLCVLSYHTGSGVRVLSCLTPAVIAVCIAMSRTCDYHHHWQDVLFGSILGFSIAIFCYRQYYNPLTSDLSGIPYVVSRVKARESPVKDCKQVESTPLLKQDKWI